MKGEIKPIDRKIIAPGNVKGFLRIFEKIGIHSQNFGKNGMELINAQSIMKFGLLAPIQAEKIEKKIRKKIFSFPLETVKTIRPEKYTYISFFAKSDKILSKYLEFSHMFPAFIISKPGALQVNGKRIQPRFILGVILPKFEGNNERKWIEGLKEFRRPIYNHLGSLIWKPKPIKK